MDSHDEHNCAEQNYPAQQARIRELNDALRCKRQGGYHCITGGIAALGYDTAEAIRRAVAEFSDFDADMDPYGEHDFGALTVLGQNVFWKIDYYDQNTQYGSPDPSDPSVTIRYMTIMLAEEY